MGSGTMTVATISHYLQIIIDVKSKLVKDSQCLTPEVDVKPYLHRLTVPVGSGTVTVATVSHCFQIFIDAMAKLVKDSWCLTPGFILRRRRYLLRTVSAGRKR